MIWKGPFLKIYERKQFDLNGYVVTFDIGECTDTSLEAKEGQTFLAAGYVLHLPPGVRNLTTSKVERVVNLDEATRLFEQASETGAIEWLKSKGWYPY
jgi:hypothetical protein